MRAASHGDGRASGCRRAAWYRRPRPHRARAPAQPPRALALDAAQGRIDRGETVETAALREVYEESGLRARIVRPIVLHEGRLHFTQFFEMTLERDDGRHDSETREVRMVTFAEAAGMLRGRRDLRVLRRLVEMRTRVVSIAAGA